MRGIGLAEIRELLLLCGDGGFGDLQGGTRSIQCILDLAQLKFCSIKGHPKV
jgi:hypothetical protein